MKQEKRMCYAKRASHRRRAGGHTPRVGADRTRDEPRRLGRSVPACV